MVESLATANYTLRFKAVFHQTNFWHEATFLSHRFSTIPNERRIQFTQRNVVSRDKNLPYGQQS